MSPVVITLKRSSNEIRLNVDMREANKAIPRTHTVMPTLDDIINELNGATVFSHLDMNHRYSRKPSAKKSPSTKINANSIRISGCIMEWCSRKKGPPLIP